jgi:hypothetical protein
MTALRFALCFLFGFGAAFSLAALVLVIHGAFGGIGVGVAFASVIGLGFAFRMTEEDL